MGKNMTILFHDLEVQWRISREWKQAVRLLFAKQETNWKEHHPHFLTHYGKWYFAAGVFSSLHYFYWGYVWNTRSGKVYHLWIIWFYFVISGDENVLRLLECLYNFLVFLRSCMSWKWSMYKTWYSYQNSVTMCLECKI